MSRRTLRGGGGSTGTFLASAPAASGDTTGATDTAAIQALINAAFTAGGGTIALLPAPNTAPYYVTQLAMKAKVKLVGAGMQATVLRAPLGQTAGTHMIVAFNDATWDITLADFTLDGANGNGASNTLGAQTNSFDGINIYTNPTGANDVQSLQGVYYTDGWNKIERVFVTQFNGTGIYIRGRNSEAHLYGCLAEWCTVAGINMGAHDGFASQCTTGFCSTGWVLLGNNQLSNCKAFWSNTPFTAGTPGKSTGTAFEIQGHANVLTGCYAQDNGIGYLISTGASNNQIVGSKASNHRIAVQQGNGHNNRVEVSVDGSGGNPLITQDYIHAAFGASLGTKHKIDITFDPAQTFSLGYVYGGDANNTQYDTSDCVIEAAGSQNVAYAASVTPDPFLGPLVKIGALTGNITIVAPSSTKQAFAGQRMSLWFTQDATGGRSITWPSGFKVKSAINPAASTTTAFDFVFDSSGVWQQVNAAPLAPYEIEIVCPAHTPVVHTSFNFLQANAGRLYGAALHNNGVNPSEGNWDLILGAGTWTLELVAQTAATSGIITWQIDDGAGNFTTVGSSDLYSSGTVEMVHLTVTGIALTGPPMKRRLKALVNSKNASSGSYYTLISGISLFRTA